MIKLLTIVGARPQFIKAACLSNTIINFYNDSIKEIIIHTGQHYDKNMSEIFFNDLNLPMPDYNLNIGSGSHGKQTAKMIEKIEEIIILENPNYLILFGDTNSTLAGAIAASKLKVDIVHIEAGLRSLNKSMPEEINRIISDHLSTYLFCPTKTAINNLINEGFKENQIKNVNVDKPLIKNIGDIMYESSIYFKDYALKKSKILSDYNLTKNNFILATVHRDFNTDNPNRLKQIIKSLIELSKSTKVIFPIHPRTEKNLNSLENFDKKSLNENLKIINPVSYFDIICLLDNCSMVVTDSGGVQKEAYFFKKPSLILRSETEWVEIIENNCAILVDVDYDKILMGFKHFRENQLEFPNIFGNGDTSDLICKILLNQV